MNEVFQDVLSKVLEFSGTYRFTTGFLVFVTLMTIYGFLSGDMAAAFTFVEVVSGFIVVFAIGVLTHVIYKLSELRAKEKKDLGLVFSWRAEKAKKDARWEKVEGYIASGHPSDWKIAILEADNILDDVVMKMGYKGETLGERMKSIEASDFPYLNEAWEVHKIRNQIAHKGTDYPLSRTEAENAIDAYHRIFKALNYL